jgi:hypothetical protein
MLALIIPIFNKLPLIRSMALKNPPVFQKVEAVIYQPAFGTAFAFQGAKMWRIVSK